MTLQEGRHSHNSADHVGVMVALYTSIRDGLGLNLRLETTHTLTVRFCSFFYRFYRYTAAYYLYYFTTGCFQILSSSSLKCRHNIAIYKNEILKTS
jgi:hypothetical protein